MELCSLLFVIPGAEFGANPRSYYESAIRAGLLTVNGNKISPDYKLQNSDLVCNRQVDGLPPHPTMKDCHPTLACYMNGPDPDMAFKAIRMAASSYPIFNCTLVLGTSHWHHTRMFTRIFKLDTFGSRYMRRRQF